MLSFGYKEVYRFFVYHAICFCPALGFKTSQIEDIIISISFLHYFMCKQTPNFKAA